MTLTGLTNTRYTLDAVPIGSGGEGDIYRVQGMGKVAKIYKAGVFSGELEEKLKIMIEHPPNASVLTQVAWPLDMAYDDAGQCCGFIMSELSINAELGEIYKYPSTLPLSAQQKINIAQNICVVISEVHKAGYVFGDFNPRNIGLDKNTGLVSFLDTDTYHVTAGNMTYRCKVCAPGYAAPELLTKCSDYVAENPSASKNAYAQTPLPTFTQETDNFALAIHIFKLMMNGYTPFGGIIETASVSQSSPGVGDAAVRRDSYCFKPGYKHQSSAILPLETLPQEVSDLFARAFITGRINPRQRPSAIEWHGALVRYEQNLVTCRDNPLHQYYNQNSECPLCEADRRFGAVVQKAAAPKLQQAVYAAPSESVQPVQPVQIPAARYVPPSSSPQPAPSEPLLIEPKSKLLVVAAVLAAVLVIAAAAVLLFMWSPWTSGGGNGEYQNGIEDGSQDGGVMDSDSPTPPEQSGQESEYGTQQPLIYHTEADIVPIKEPMNIYYGRWNFIAQNPEFNHTGNFMVGNRSMSHGIGMYITSSEMRAGNTSDSLIYH